VTVAVGRRRAAWVASRAFIATSRARRCTAVALVTGSLVYASESSQHQGRVKDALRRVFEVEESSQTVAYPRSEHRSRSHSPSKPCREKVRLNEGVVGEDGPVEREK
jgi:hypothetical protein